MDCLDSVERPKQFGFSGPRGAAANVYTADGTLTAEENGTSSPISKVGEMAGLQARNSGYGRVHRRSHGDNMGKTRNNTPAAWRGCLEGMMHSALAVSVFNPIPAAHCVVQGKFLRVAHPPLRVDGETILGLSQKRVNKQLIILRSY